MQKQFGLIIKRPRTLIYPIIAVEQIRRLYNSRAATNSKSPKE